MFPKTKNMESSFRLIRTTCVAAIIGSFCFAGYAFYAQTAAAARAQQRVYILAAGKMLEALASDRRENLPVEIRDHVRTFHELFFTLDPDEKVIGDNLSRALYLADGSARQVYDNLKEAGYYASVISANISQRVSVDSVWLDMGNYPFHFRCYGVETITRVTSIVTRELITEGYLREVSRSDNNPHGFLIERWVIVSNRDVKTESR